MAVFGLVFAKGVLAQSVPEGWQLVLPVIQKLDSNITDINGTIKLSVKTTKKYVHPKITDKELMVEILEHKYIEKSGACWSEANIKTYLVLKEGTSLKLIPDEAGGKKEKNKKPVDTVAVAVNMGGGKPQNAKDADVSTKDKKDTCNYTAVDGQAKLLMVGVDITPASLNVSLISNDDKLLSISDIKAVSNKYRFGLTAYYSPMFSYSRVFVNDADFANQKELDARKEQSRPVYAYSAGLSAGYWVTPNHQIYLDINYQKLGFETKLSKVDWNTGYLKDTSTSGLYHFNLSSVGLGYTYVYTAPKKTIGVVLDAALMVSFKNKVTDVDTDITGSYKFNNPVLSGRLGAGINFRFCKWLSYSFMPCMYFGVTPAHRKDISTRVFGAGIASRLEFRF
jgi:outer membrane protease